MDKSFIRYDRLLYSLHLCIHKSAKPHTVREINIIVDSEIARKVQIVSV